MPRFRPTVLLGMTILVAVLTGCRSRPAAKPPSIQTIVQAMQAQLTARGKGLEVSYQRHMDGSPAANYSNRRYVWTPHMLYADDRQTGGRWIASLDTTTGEYRSLLMTRKGNKFGVIGTEAPPGQPLANADTMDPLIRPLDDSDLITVVSRGKVYPVMEDIEGHSCWRIDCPARVFGFKRYLIWVDPAVGFSPRKLETDSKSLLPTVDTFSRYVRVTSGAWFPTEMTAKLLWPRTANSRPRIVSFVSEASSIKANLSFTPADLRIVFPSGTQLSRWPSPGWPTKPPKTTRVP